MTSRTAQDDVTKRGTNPLDEKMTRAQVARRKFKAGLPRKMQSRELSVNGALGETFTLLDNFRSLAPDPDKAILAALAYYRDSNPKLAEFLIVPDPGSKVGDFCDQVVALAKPRFLGLVFIHVDPETENPAYRCVSFAVPFMGGTEAAARLHFAQKELLNLQQKVLEGLHT